MDFITWLLWMLWVFIPSQTTAKIITPTVPPAHPYTVGRATFYSQGLMEYVAKGRGIGLDGASGFSTYPDCTMIGGTIYVSVLDPHDKMWSPWSVKRIVDCSQPDDYSRHVAEGLIELSYEDARMYGYLAEGHAKVHFYLGGSASASK